MRELEYTVLELEEESKKTCDFCSKLENKNNESVHQIRVRSKITGEWISDDMVCERCEKKYGIMNCQSAIDVVDCKLS